MKALDTNVLVRFLVNDDPGQAELIRKRLKHAEASRDVFFIPLLVTLETLWVLNSVYEIDRKDIILAMENLLLMPILEFEALQVVQSLLISAKENRIDLADLLIGYSAQFSGCTSVLTFDKKAAKFGLFELIG